jgi:hypothetical protein
MTMSAIALQEPRVRDYVLASGYEQCASSPHAFGQFIREELKRFTEISRGTHMKVH